MIFWSVERGNRPLENIEDRSHKDQVEAGRKNKNSWFFVNIREMEINLEVINWTSSYQD